MAKFEALINDVGRFYTSVYNGAKRSAERVVDELQQEGPSWTGRFSNSWQISEGRTRVSGDGQPGEPRPLHFPAAPAGGSRLFTKNDVVVFSISNSSAHSDLARDLVTGSFFRPTEQPQTQLGLRKWERINEGRNRNVLRGQIGGGKPGNGSSRTADLDWYTTYVNSGKIQRVIQTELSASVQRLG